MSLGECFNAQSTYLRASALMHNQLIRNSPRSQMISHLLANRSVCAGIIASRRSVFTRSPTLHGISAGATTSQQFPSRVSCRCINPPQLGDDLFRPVALPWHCGPHRESKTIAPGAPLQRGWIIFSAASARQRSATIITPGPYLLPFAQEAAWREDQRRKPNGSQVDRVVALAMGVKPSVDFRGYWQRSRAACPVMRLTI
jgi:hypothetical protein